MFTVYFSLKYLECNNYNVHYALTTHLQLSKQLIEEHQHIAILLVGWD